MVQRSNIRMLVSCIQNNVTGTFFKTWLYTLDMVHVHYIQIHTTTFNLLLSFCLSLSFSFFFIGYISVHSITTSIIETLMALVFLLLEIYSSFAAIPRSSRNIINFPGFSCVFVCHYVHKLFSFLQNRKEKKEKSRNEMDCVLRTDTWYKYNRVAVKCVRYRLDTCWAENESSN